MRYYNHRSLNKIFKIVMLTVLISFSFYSIGFSEGEKAGRLEKLIQELKDINPGVRCAAVCALGDIKDARAVDPLIVALKDDDSNVRRNAANVLGATKNTRAVDPLIAALKDKSDGVRCAAVYALKDIKDTRAVDPLIAALKDEDLEVRRRAADALVSIGTPSINPLIAALKDKNSDVRRRAAIVLCKIKDARATEPLIGALRDEDLAIIAGAYSFFIKRGTSGSETILSEALNHYGTPEMAQDFLNCGNSLLEEAGNNWAKKYGYQFYTQLGGSSGPRWKRK